MNKTTTHPASGTTNGRLLRPLLWLALILSGGANAATSSLASTGGAHSHLLGGLSAGFGVIALASGAALVVHHYKHRRTP